MNEQRDDYDSPWKDMLEAYFKDFMYFFFPEVAEGVDWGRGYKLWGCEVGIRFPVVKVTDYLERWDELEKNDNPFAVVVMAHLKTRETRGDNEKRKKWKIYLIKKLYERGYKREDVINLFRFIDWIMDLPKDLEKGFWHEVSQL